MPRSVAPLVRSFVNVRSSYSKTCPTNAMADIDKWSDEQIRAKLTELGFPIMPITGTTRKLMVKKLRLLLDNTNSRDTDGYRRSMGSFSSEEESDREGSARLSREKNKKNTKVTARKSIATGLRDFGKATPPPPIRRSFLSNNHKDNNDNDAAKDTSMASPSISKHTVTTTTTKVVKTYRDGFDTGSDSEPEVIHSNSVNNRETPHSLISSSSSGYISPIRANDLSARYSGTPSTSPVSGTGGDAGLQNLQQIRSRPSLGTGSRPLSTSTPEPQPPAPPLSLDKYETPYLSNFTRRLSQLSSPKTRYDIIKEHDTNGAGSYLRGNVARSARYQAEMDRYARQHKSGMLRDNWVSFAVLGVAFLFFVLIGAMYYGIRNGRSALEIYGDSIPQCNKLPGLKPGFGCIASNDVESTVNLLKTVKPELIKNAVEFICERGSKGKVHLSESEILNLQKLKTIGFRNQETLSNLELLVLNEPRWGISILDDEGTALKSMNEVVAKRQQNHTIFLAFLNPPIPWSCIIANKIYAALNTILVVFGMVLSIYAASYGYKTWKKYQEEQKKQVFNIVEQIINVLQSSDEEYLVINHVRDMILPLNDRKRLEQVWNKSMQFINDDSRVRTEVQVVQGEPYQVWRWLGNNSLSGLPRSKTWQGQAFETESGSMNSLPYSPTPCLKIRGMVDNITYNQAAIKDAVLSKCADRCRILHCAVDTATRCVYLKCANQNDAAIAYKNLHGWWYAGHLVTVKYLRLERYVQRFPDSPVNGPPYLKASAPSAADKNEDDD